jgi:hypothetical protein
MRGKRIKESKNKRENTDRARGSSGARGRHGGIEDEKEKKDEDGSGFFPLFGS